MDASVLFDRKARAIPVALLDLEVKATLRLLGQPICLFGERSEDRKLRLQRVCAAQGLSKPPPVPSANSSEMRPSRPAHEFLSHGTEALHKMRFKIAEASVQAATRRLKALRAEFVQSPEPRADAARVNSNVLRSFTLVKQVANVKVHHRMNQFPVALSFTAVSSPSPQQSVFATGSDDRSVALWSAATGQRLVATVGHSLRVNHVDTKHDTDGGVLVASCSNDRLSKLWRVAVTEEGSNLDCPLQLHGHVARVVKVRFAPRLPLLATASADGTARLWDVVTGEALSVFDCCARGARSIAFHPDGSLACIADESGHSFLCDLRTGRYIAILESANGPSLDVAFSPAGTHVVVGGGDGTLRVFDLRTTASKGSAVDKNNVTPAVAIIAAHNDWITQVGFAPTVTSSLVANIVSTSIDGTIAAHDGSTGLLLSRRIGAMCMFGDTLPFPVRGFTFASNGEDRMADLITVAHEPHWRAWAAATGEGAASSRLLQTFDTADTLDAPCVQPDADDVHDAAEDVVGDDDDEDDDDPFAGLKRK